MRFCAVLSDRELFGGCCLAEGHAAKRSHFAIDREAQSIE
jgi:hypothetical protein